jgi:hypothetical protein
MRYMQTSAGERLYRYVLIKVFQPGNKAFEKVYRRAPGGSGIGDQQIQKMLFAIADRLEKERAAYEYRVVELAPNQFNFVCAGKTA